MSHRPSRLGRPAGAAPAPDYLLPPDAGFPGLLKRTWAEATAAADPATAVRVLLTLGGHVPADVQLRALRSTEEAALAVLAGVSWRGVVDPHPADLHADPAGSEDPGDATDPADAAAPPAAADPADAAGEAPVFLGEIGLTIGGRVAVRVPSQGPLNVTEDLVEGAVIRVPWSARALRDYQRVVEAAGRRHARSVTDCRRWLTELGPRARAELLEELKRAALRTAPFILYQDAKQYTNFRDRNSITGKTLWPGHPDCALSSLEGIPLHLWSDSDVLVVVCLALLVRSAGYQRIEEANGTQLTVEHVAHLLEQVRLRYNEVRDEVRCNEVRDNEVRDNEVRDNEVPGRPPMPAAGSRRVADLAELAGALRARRQELLGDVTLYREIHGVLVHKIERVAGSFAALGRRRERALCASLQGALPVSGDTLAELGESVAADPGWLARPYGGFGTGLEALVHATVAGANRAFDADFAMSRGMRSLPTLVAALRAGAWAEIAGWDITSYFCCVVPSADAPRLFDDSPTRVADVAWSMSSRMQYNSWHFIAGNLPRTPDVETRDYFVPPGIPDLAYFSDQHHNGHVAARVRFSIRSPQPVRVLDRTFAGFVDLRLLRCEGEPFGEQDLLAAHRTSRFVAEATTQLARLVATGADAEVTSFDSRWHWATIAAGAPAPQSPAAS
jgi:hypothetical protein